MSALSAGELTPVARLLAEAAHHPYPRERLLQVRRERADRLARAPEGARRGEPEPDASGGHRQQHDEGQQGELDVEDKQDHERPEQGEAGLEERDDGVRDERVECLHVVRDARYQHPCGAALVEADRQRLQVGEDADAQVLQRALADPADEVGLRGFHRPRDPRGGEERDDRDHEDALVLLFDAFVDRQLREQRRRDGGRRPQQQRKRGEQAAAPVGTQQPDQAAQVAHARAAIHSVLASGARASAPSSCSSSSESASRAPRATSSR